MIATVICNTCKTQVPYARFCANCGQELQTVATPQQEQKSGNWLQNASARNKKEQTGWSPAGVKSSTKTGIGDDWLVVLTKRIGAFLAPRAKSAYQEVKNNMENKTTTEKKSLIPSFGDPKIELRVVALSLALNMAALFMLYGMSAFSAADPIRIVLVFGLTYIGIRILGIPRLTTQKVFDSSRCSNCLKTMKKIYGVKEDS